MPKNAAGWLRKRLEALKGLEAYGYPEAWSEGRPAKGYKIKLDANENYFVPAELLSRVLMEAMEGLDLRLYPVDEYLELAEELSRLFGIPSDSITFGSGSGQLIDDILIGFARNGARVVSLTPSFSLYRLRPKLMGARLVEVKIKEDMSLDVDAILRASGRYGIIFICSPNNPTGNQFGDEVLSIAERFKGLLVLDEAYADFADQSFMKKALDYENVIALRTFSKAYGLAGIRMGYMVSNEELAKVMRSRIQRPYSVSSLALRVARKALEHHEEFMVCIGELKKERERLIKRLKGLERIKAFESKANFVMFGSDDGSLGERLAERGTLIRYLGKILGDGYYYRVAVGLPEMNEEFLSGLEAILG